jgi:hypothetical protein
MAAVTVPSHVARSPIGEDRRLQRADDGVALVDLGAFGEDRQLGRLAEGEEHAVADEVEVAAFDLHRTAAAGLVGFAQLHAPAGEHVLIRRRLGVILTGLVR